jgi:hypothetical protein
MIHKNAVQKMSLISNMFIAYYFILPILTLYWEMGVFLNGRYGFLDYYLIHVCSYLSLLSILNALVHQQAKLIIIKSYKNFTKALNDYIEEKIKENDK